MSDLKSTVKKVVEEYERGGVEYGSFTNYHGGYAIILEELDELWGEVKTFQGKEQMAKEAIQVAATAIRFVVDLCMEEGP